MSTLRPGEQVRSFAPSLFDSARKEAVLLLTMHHIVSDGWSIGVLYKELKQLYEAFRDYRTSPLAELPLQYADFAAWQQRRVEEGRLDREAAYWIRQLDQLPPACTFPATGRARAIQSYRGAIEQVFIDGHLIDRLRSFALRENVTLFMTLLAAFKTLLFRYNGQDDCVVGVPIASRPQEGVGIADRLLRQHIGLAQLARWRPVIYRIACPRPRKRAWRLRASGHSARADHGRL